MFSLVVSIILCFYLIEIRTGLGLNRKRSAYEVGMSVWLSVVNKILFYLSMGYYCRTSVAECCFVLSQEPQRDTKSRL